MPVSISLSGLTWSTPNTPPLRTDLSLSFGAERTGLVGRNGSGKSTLLRLIAGVLAPPSGTVTVIGSLAMMHQDTMGRPEDTIADLFGVRDALQLLARAEAGLATLEDVASADWTLPARMEAALARFGLDLPPQTRLATLSGGQRSRAALAALVLAEPDFLLLDEPTNNLDEEGRHAVITLLQGWKGGAIVASHDRALLAEMDAIVELTTLGVTRYGGNYAAYRAQKATAFAAAQRDLAHAEKARAEIAQRARVSAERKARKDRAGRKTRATGSQPKMALDLAKAKAELSGGVVAQRHEARCHEAEAQLARARDALEVLTPARMDIAPTGLAASKTVLRLDHITGGHDAADPLIRDLSLFMTGPERLVLAGPNGSGKSTLLRIITGQIAPYSGQVALAVRFALLDQNLGLLDPVRSLRDNFMTLNADATPHQAHAALARFGFRAAEAQRMAGALSGGERLRAGLACTLGATPPPQLLILDEPTNHLDLDGIDALEAALAAYDGAVLAVSHDPAFRDALRPHRVCEIGSVHPSRTRPPR